MAATVKIVSGIFSFIKCARATQSAKYLLQPQFLNISHYSTGVNHMNAVAPADNDGVDELYKRIFVEIKSFEPAVMDSYQKFVTMVAKELDIKTPIVHLPDKKYTLERRTLLRSVHIHKKHRRQYEIRTHYKTFEFSHLTGSTADTLLEYIQRNLPEGVAMKVTKHKIERLPTRFQKDNNKAIQESTSC